MYLVWKLRIWSLHLLLLKQATSPRAWCWGLSLLLRVLWSQLWKEPLLHIPLSPVLCLLHFRGWLCWYLCPQLLVERGWWKTISRIAFNISFIVTNRKWKYGSFWRFIHPDSSLFCSLDLSKQTLVILFLCEMIQYKLFSCGYRQGKYRD